MKCSICNNLLNKTKKLYHYTESGLDNVYLVGIDVFKCKKCGNVEAKIPRIDELHLVIAICIISKKQRLNNKEIRYLRKYMGFKAVDLARKLAISRSTLSRWEAGTQKIGPTNDKLLRLMVIRYKEEQYYSLFPVRIVDKFESIGTDVTEKERENKIQFNKEHQTYSCVSLP